MAADYEIWLADDRGIKLEALDYSIGFTASRIANDIGVFVGNFPITFDESLLSRDRMIQVWRKPNGGELGLWRCYFLRRWEWLANAERESVYLYAPCQNELLSRRIVAAYAGTEYSSKSAAADDMLKEVVTEALSDSLEPTPDDGTRDWSNFSVEPDVSAGPTISDSFAWKRLLSDGGGMLADIVKAAKIANGTELFFDVDIDTISTTGEISFIFRTSIGQLGSDRSSEITFSMANSNLTDISLEEDYTDEENYIYSLGQNEGMARTVVQVYDTERTGASIWNRREAVVEARNKKSAGAVEEAGRASLVQGEGKVRFSGRPLDTAGTRFGIDWNFGDKVKAVYRIREFYSIIRAMVLSVNDQGEVITSRLDYDS